MACEVELAFGEALTRNVEQGVCHDLMLLVSWRAPARRGWPLGQIFLCF